jgi:16S rRNA C967 or C1407 C5-methylase (RsmB/RsmF family)
MSTAKSKKGNNLSRNQQKKIEKATLALQQQNLLFDRYYADHYGEDRWYHRLKPALGRKGKHVALVNRRAEFEICKKVLDIIVDDLHTAPSNPVSSVSYLPTYFPNVYIRSSNYTPQGDGHIGSGSIEVPSKPLIDPLLDEEGEKQVLTTKTWDETLGHDTTSIHLPWPSPSLSSSLDNNGLCVYYPLDYASLIPVLLMNIQTHDHVLDLCAAPGGKSLAISQLLKLSSDDYGIQPKNNLLHSDLGYLECNDISPDRRLRLVKVLKNYLPPPCLLRTHVNLGDATKHSFLGRFGSERKFDCILLDAPCSSERHLLQEFYLAQERLGKAPHLIPEQAKEYMSWTVNRSKSNADRQLLLLWNALSLCRVGGRVVYSTCALSPLENDGVIEKLIEKLQKKKDKAGEEDMIRMDMEIVPVEEKQMPFGEKTRYGWQILPDNNAWGWGPIYTAVIHKIA